MRAQRRESTSPEVRLRRCLFAHGLRFRLHQPLLHGRARKIDIVLPKHRAAVFVDGCFWHGCPQHGTRPKVNRWYWDAKFSRNQARDRDTDRRLRALGWKVFRFWEHLSPESAAARVAKWVAVRESKRTGSASGGARRQASPHVNARAPHSRRKSAVAS
ncbi:MAG: very short patch repair endonuclease [Planctomycetia bacterium]|nr:very short patch repair endonuclease [Planctomycetia bacterium]